MHFPVRPLIRYHPHTLSARIQGIFQRCCPASCIHSGDTTAHRFLSCHGELCGEQLLLKPLQLHRQQAYPQPHSRAVHSADLPSSSRSRRPGPQRTAPYTPLRWRRSTNCEWRLPPPGPPQRENRKTHQRSRQRARTHLRESPRLSIRIECSLRPQEETVQLPTASALASTRGLSHSALNCRERHQYSQTSW